MYKILVVDDEKIVLDGVKYIVENNIEDAKIISTARSGKEAIEMVEKEKPDIIIMDIRMPGINGIEAIKEIKTIYHDIKFIIVSAYEQFEFAKEAVSLGVKEYILKPINRYKLVEAINRATQEIIKEKRTREKELENIEKLEMISPMLEQGFIYSIFMNREFGDELSKYRELLGLNNNGGYIMILQFGEGEKAYNLSNKIGSGIKSQSIYPIFCDILKYKCKCIVGPVMINRIIVFVSSKEKEDEYLQRIEAIEIAEYVAAKLTQNTDVEFFIGIGGYREMEEISYSLDEAIKALWYNDGERVLHIKDITYQEKESTFDIKALENKLIDKMQLGDEKETINIINNIFEKILKAYTTKAKNFKVNDKIKNKIMELMVISHRTAQESGVIEDSYFKYDGYIEEMLSMNNFEDLKRWCEKRVRYISKKIFKIKENKLCKVIEDAKLYINTNYSKEITLEDVSKEVCISPQYFSRLFKEETGYNFIEYLIDLRIERAKELLTNTNMSIKEICFEVGYGDPNYFSRLFKKIVGMAATEYIKNV